MDTKILSVKIENIGFGKIAYRVEFDNPNEQRMIAENETHVWAELLWKWLAEGNQPLPADEPNEGTE